jgi:putative transcription factor
MKARPKMQTGSLPKGYTELELRDDYANRIRKAREKLGLSQEDLAKLAKERLSIIQKIELEKMIPNLQLSRTLEHVLRMKLMIPAAEPDAPKQTLSETPELTIGDVIQFKKERKQTKES